jgi:hypothetical protein
MIRCLAMAMLVSVLTSLCAIAGESARDVTGTVRLDGKTPPLKVWPLDDVMRLAIGEKTYREEKWLIGMDQGLANCVVTLRNKAAGQQVKAKPQMKANLDKVGVRYVPRVLVISPGTEIVLRNKESPCRGFTIVGKSGREPAHSWIIREGTERKITLHEPDVYSVTCPVRTYAQGYIRVTDSPYTAVTNHAGQFIIRGVPAGEYDVEIWHESARKAANHGGPARVIVTDKDVTIPDYRLKVPNSEPK